MPYAAVAEKLKKIPEQYLGEVSDFCDFILFRIKDVQYDVPNEELTLALQESEKMLSNPNTKRFGSVQALFDDLDAEDLSGISN